MSNINSVSSNVSGVSLSRTSAKKAPEVKSDVSGIDSQVEKFTPSRSESTEKTMTATKAEAFTEAPKPFTEDEAKKALEYFMKNGMDNGSKAGLFKKSLLFHSQIKTPDEALSMLKNKKPVYIKNEQNKYSRIDNMDNLQVLDSLKGRGENTILPQNQFDALRFLEKGPGEKDGLYNPGFLSKAKVNSYDAYYAMRKGEEIDVNVGGQTGLRTHSPDDLAEVNALYGEGKNTILPDNQFEAIKYFDGGDDQNGGFFVKKKRLNAYDALQLLQEGKDVRINTPSQKNLTARSAEDLAEADAFYGRGQNTIMTDKEFKLFQYFDKGKDGDDGFYVAGGKSNAYGALQQFQAGSGAQVNIGDKHGMTVKGTEDMAELNAFYGNEDNIIMSEAHMDSMKYFDGVEGYRGSDGGKINAYEALQLMQDGKAARIKNNGITERVYTPEDVHELDALEGRGKNTILPQNQYDNLQTIKPFLYESGGYGNYGKMSAYGALQKFQAGDSVTYTMQGGDFGGSVSRRMENIDDIPDALTRLANQQEYDKYKFSDVEYRDKTLNELNKTPEKVEDDRNEAESNIDDSERKISRQEDNIRDSEDDLERGRRDFRRAEHDLHRAEMMPDFIEIEDPPHGGHGGHGGGHGDHGPGGPGGGHGGPGGPDKPERRRVENEEKRRRIHEARREMDYAMRKIRDAEEEISEARDAIRDAEREIEVSQYRINMDDAISSALPGFEALISGLSDGDFESKKEAIESKLAYIKNLADSCGDSLQGNLYRQSKLLDVMTTRPDRPEGWVPPEPRMEE